MNSVELKMSERLVTIGDMLSHVGNYLADYSGRKLRTADVGCDHGYISIYLAEKDISSSCIAMDVRKGPLSGAAANIKEQGFEDRIQTRLSDGLKELKKGEVDTVVIAGMGGDLMKRIITDSDIASLGIKAGVLQPQSELCEFRSFLRESGYHIAEERIVFEDGKYYFPMLVIFDRMPADSAGQKDAMAAGAAHREQPADSLSEAIALLRGKENVTEADALAICNTYGEHNILRRDPLLKQYLLHGQKINESIIKNLDEGAHAERLSTIQKDLHYMNLVLTTAF
ncbi:MAG: SAM-dependent methyltransferase [Butyrivibrio sp.]|nr:SAM-dependent methyltransferase [Butyrivibrio sp.]